MHETTPPWSDKGRSLANKSGVRELIVLDTHQREDEQTLMTARRVGDLVKSLMVR